MPSSLRNRWTRCLICLLALAFLTLGAYGFRAQLLAGLAKAWVVDEPLTNADAIVILGGCPETRPFAAARLFHDGVAPRILYMNVRVSAAEAIAGLIPEREKTRLLLLSNSVPESAITLIGTNVASTYDESRAVRAWTEQSGARSILIPTDPFHTRRVRWIFNKELQGTGTVIDVVAINAASYRTVDWWKHEEGLIAFQNEFIKYIYYRCKY